MADEAAERIAKDEARLEDEKAKTEHKDVSAHDDCYTKV